MTLTRVQGLPKIRPFQASYDENHSILGPILGPRVHGNPKLPFRDYSRIWHVVSMSCFIWSVKVGTSGRDRSHPKGPSTSIVQYIPEPRSIDVVGPVI